MNNPCIRTGNCEASYDAYTAKGKIATDPHVRKAYVPVDTIDKKEYYINLNENERKLIEQKNLTAHTAEHPLLQGLTKNVRMVKGDDIKNVRIVDKNLIETIIRAAMPITERTREDHDYNLAIQDMLKTLLLNINEGDVINLVKRIIKNNLAIQDMLKTLLLNINEGDVINLVKRIIKNVFETSGDALLDAPSFFVELFSALESELINRIASMGNDDDLIKAVTKVLKRFTHDAVVPLAQKKSHGAALTDLVNTANKLMPSAKIGKILNFHPQFRLPNP
tara:strand:+ start:178 stop:1014 length:837 start_codon:yes stop_codon:yes gene_type:complete